jgi:CRISPR system Cascade subunit CasC
MTVVTVHLLRELPMHNLNRDQNGLPKSQFDGGIQRARISSQATKRPARIQFRKSVSGMASAPASFRTMDSNAVVHVVRRAREIAGEDFDEAAAKKAASAVVRSLAKSTKEDADGSDSAPAATKKDNILLFSDAEFDTLAQALADAQRGGNDPDVDDFIQDFKSPSLDIAAFGRMFANRADKSTQGAVAVSHAVTTHEMSLTIDYFTAVDDYEADEPKQDSGAGHLGLAYFTSGVYYSTFTVDPGQLVRSWSSISAPSARDQLIALVEALITALPSGKLTNTNAHTFPYVVVVEEQHLRNAYGFETPVSRAREGGYKESSVRALSHQASLARTFQASNYVDTIVYSPEFVLEIEGSRTAANLREIAEEVASKVLAALPSGA